jgi:class 3 adenylate cyclase/streptogramin lyase
MAGRSALVTVLFTDIVGSTEIASEMGDPRWRELLARHHRIVRSELRRFGGREIDTAGDGFFAAFDRPAQAVRCACSIVQSVRELGIEVRAGVHVGEAEVMGRGLGGMAVHTGARIVALAGPGEVLVSGTLRDLVPGATFGFDDRGVRELKGIRETPRVLAVTEVDEAALPPPLDGEEAASRRRAIAPPPVHRRRPVWIAAGIVGLAAATAIILLLRSDDQLRDRSAVVRSVAVLVDPGSRRVSASIPLPPAAHRGQLGRSQVAVGLGSVWVINGECVCRIDPETRQVDAITVPFPDQIALGHRAAWVSTLNNEIYPVEAAADEASEAIALPPQQIFHASLTTTDDAVWTVFSNQLARIDPVRETISEPVELEHGGDDVIGVGRDLWIVDQLGRTLYQYGPDGAAIDTVELPITPDDVMAGPDGSLWVLNRSGGTVTKVDADGRLDQPIRVGADPTDVAVGPDAVWVADRAGRTIQRIDPTLGRPDEPIRLPGPVAAIGVDGASGEVWAFLD